MTTTPKTVKVEWQGGARFRGGVADGPTLLIDADAKDAPGPMVTLLIALMSCSGADIVSLMEKMQVKLRKLTADVRGTRADDYPKRYTAIHFVFRMAGDGLDETKARRAIDLSFTKYCSAIQSLKPDIPITYDVTVEA